MSDRQVVVLAVVTMAGAWRALAIPPALVVAVVVAALLAQRAPVVWLAAAMTASVLGARSWAGVEHAPTTGFLRGPATVVTDPVRVPGGVRLELRVDDSGRRVQATASGDAGALLGSRLAGERVRVEGRLAGIQGSRGYLARRHIGSRLIVTAADDPGPGGPLSRFANQLRRTLVVGADSMSAPRRALFTGLVIGDDRDQDAIEVDDFRAAGLTHLLAVSGQNVAFVLAVAAPLLRRLGLRGRLVAGAGVLATFGVLTRWEPSVLRAVAMAALAMVAMTSGRPASSIRLLALAVTALVLIDPMLAGSVGFLLSVGACAGIAVVGPLLERLRIPPALAITAAAQIGVAPVLIPAFGEMPLASLPANLLAGPAAGPVMVWGLVGGLPAGLLGGRAAEVLHLPTRALLAWIAGVARLAAALSLPHVDARGGLALIVIAGVWLGLRTRPRSLAVAAVAAVMAAPALTTADRRSPTVQGREIAAGSSCGAAAGPWLWSSRATPTSGAPSKRCGRRASAVSTCSSCAPAAAGRPD